MTDQAQTSPSTAQPRQTRPAPAKPALSFADAATLNFANRWLILLGLILAAIMEILDTTIINVALPQMAGNLGATIEEIAWVSTAYILANVVVLPMTAFLTARFGRRDYLTASIIVFTISSFFCGTSHSLGEMIIWRLLQGAAGASLISTAQATLVQVFPPREQGVVQPLFLAGLVVAPTIGPALGGYITDSISWNWCFFINIPIGIIAGFLVFTLLRDTEAKKTNEPVDWLGIGLLTVGLSGLQYVLEEGERNDWFADASILRIFIVALICLACLVPWLLSSRNTHPVVDLRVLRSGSLSAGIALFIVVGFGLYGVLYLYPLLAQGTEGMSTIQTGLALLPGGFATAVSIVFCGAVTSNPKSKLDPRLLVALGVSLQIIAMWFLGHLSPVSGQPDTFWPLLIRGAAIGFMMIPVNSLALSTLTPSDVNQGAALLGLARQLGGSFGIALLATYLESHQHIDRANLIANITPTNPAYTQMSAQIAGGLTASGLSAPDAHQTALGMIDQFLTTQVAVKSYDDTFLLLMLISLATLPAILLLRKPKPGATPAPAAH